MTSYLLPNIKSEENQHFLYNKTAQFNTQLHDNYIIVKIINKINTFGHIVCYNDDIKKSK